MIRLELTQDEARILHRVLETELLELSGEIADTDRLEYRDILKERARVLRHLRETLGPYLAPQDEGPRTPAR